MPLTKANCQLQRTGKIGNIVTPVKGFRQVKVVAAGKKHRKFLGRPAITAEQIQRCQKQGFRFFQSAADIDLLTVGATQLLKPFGKARESAFVGGL